MRHIPKIIHLIWFGKNPYSPIINKCLNSWSKYCPDYEIRLWNEDSFDINSNTFVKEAYEAKKWAFVSDYVRLYALYNEGGVYIDSDVELLKPIDNILEDYQAVTGYSSSRGFTTGFMAASKGNIWIKELLDYYANRHFINSDGSFDMKVNNAIVTDISKEKFGFKNGDKCIQKGNVVLYPYTYFHPFSRRALDYNKVDLKTVNKYFKITKDTYCIHYVTASWVDNRNTLLYKIKHLVRIISPQKLTEFLERLYYHFHKWTVKE